MAFFSEHAGDGEVQKWRLYYLGLSTPLYWTDCTDVDIEWDGFTWVAQPITPGPVSNQPDGASASFKIADGDGNFFATFYAAGGGELALAAIYEAGFLTTNGSPTPDEVLEIFSGRIDRASVQSDTEDSIEIILMPPAQEMAITLPTRLVSTLLRA